VVRHVRELIWAAAGVVLYWAAIDRGGLSVRRRREQATAP
jgi:hypothetical protein